MQDRFKFRFWDKEKREYFTCGELEKNAKYLTYPYRTYNLCFCDNSIISEPCTGIKDKNEKLIYEGDIIRVDDDVCKVEWEEENARYNVSGYGEIAYLNYNEIEVIGNIHENPELLDMQND